MNFIIKKKKNHNEFRDIVDCVEMTRLWPVIDNIYRISIYSFWKAIQKNTNNIFVVLWTVW